MANIELLDYFEKIGIIEHPKLGFSPEEELQKEPIFKTNRDNIEFQLNKAAQARAKTINRLNLTFYILTGTIIISILIQLYINNDKIILTIQTACIVALFPISKKIEANTTTQAYIEFTAVFLKDLEPKEAIQAINHLYQSISSPSSLKKAMQPA